ncbi:Peptidase S8 and S53 subtilisin kexin sedolisin [Nitrosarchaeum koreense MY1]|uniref:Peptidase S8 and S53 subtilisin kexin sedolisin n=1 Tax=Nitrosarchaeum koreense MY1 TaxID=1001994 RepID=F9CUS4_9ARCH|nr:Peptidase S8 and S53 subtilisin kexin sedolisin [Nitrosarchaeum koreense MY1]
MVVFSSLIIFQLLPNDNFHTYIEQSVPFIGGDIPRMEGFDGTGIKIAVIDTGVDYNHPDLFGFGPDGKVVGGYNFINEGEPPLDTNGHGTQVAGVIAANGILKGVAPNSKILAYKVSENGEGVSSDLIIKAINKSIEDNADIINISLGVNKTNSNIDKAVNNALQKGIIVITAAGNDGPIPQTIGSPGKNPGSITVGATYNNLTSSLIATLEVNEKPYTVIPMTGSAKLDEPIIGKIVFGGYGKEAELKKINATNAILLVERGSDVEGEMLYFSIKEKNAVNAGAKAMIVYNNQPGIFLGQLIHEFIEPNYKPQIPVVSIDRKEGLEIKELGESKASLHVFYNPDFVAHFSSRGPVSPFYIKPDLVAPGAYINTTQTNGGYNFTSGTSFAAPHVSGSVALLLEKYPTMTNDEIKSLLMTTSEMVSDAYGSEFSLSDTGSGRLNLGKAFDAKLIITPPNFVVNLSSDNKMAEKELKLKLLNGTLDNLDVTFEGPEFIQVEDSLQENNLTVKIKISGENYGTFQEKIFINHDKIKYTVPIQIHYTKASIGVIQNDNSLFFTINDPDWNFAKISVTKSNTEVTDVITATPNKDAKMRINQNGEYWIEAKIKSNDQTLDAYNTIIANSIDETQEDFEILDIPQRQVAIVVGIIAIIGIVGAVKIKSAKRDTQDLLK